MNGRSQREPGDSRNVLAFLRYLGGRPELVQ